MPDRLFCGVHIVNRTTLSRRFPTLLWWPFLHRSVWKGRKISYCHLHLILLISHSSLLLLIHFLMNQISQLCTQTRCARSQKTDGHDDKDYHNKASACSLAWSTTWCFISMKSAWLSWRHLQNYNFAEVSSWPSVLCDLARCACSWSPHLCFISTNHSYTTVALMSTSLTYM